MDIKTGTQTWSTAPQQAIQKPDNTNTMSATDKDQALHGETLGDTLNKVSDPNYVDTSKKMRTTGNNQLNKDAFMNLLLTQMKNQDPTNPLKSHEMAAQLAQFTSLEKLTNIDASIGALRKDQEPDHNFQALNLIGKAVNTDNSRLTHTDATQSHDVRFDLAGDASEVNIAIKDANGTVIRQLKYPNIKKGKVELNWNGQMEDGSAAPVGDYSVDVQAASSNGHKVYAEMKVAGVITGVNFTPKGPQLLVGKQTVNLSDVKSIVDPAMQHAEAPKLGGRQVAMAPNQMKKVEVKQEASTEQNAKKARLAKGDIGDAAMTQDFINNLNKEGAKAGSMQGTGKDNK
jgi:flagellar basal-body rod modification protein FlgD